MINVNFTVDYININIRFVMIPKLIWRQLWTRHPLIPSRLPYLENPLRCFSTRVSDEEVSFGSYSVILPDEPFVWGVSHITPRAVPPSIGRPPYARILTDDESPEEPYGDDSRIRLGSEEEPRLRASARLARKVREFSKTIVRVGCFSKFNR